LGSEPRQARKGAAVGATIVCRRDPGFKIKMSHTVLALKFRPQKFSDIVGQEHITTTLKNSIKHNRIAHAYLFTGSRGVGKTTTARILAKCLNCENGPTIEPCNNCRNCKEISKSISIDVEEIDGASNRGINEVRELKDKAQYQPINSRYKIFIIDEVHMLTNEAFNALLKIIEEPPKHVIFIMATTEPHKIPPTILSRCQRFDFKKLSINEIISNMEKILNIEGYNIDKLTLFKIAKKSEGSMRDALSILEQVINFYFDENGKKYIDEFLNYIDTSFFNELIRDILNKNANGVISKIRDLFFSGTDFKIFTSEFINYLENLILIKTLKDDFENFIQEPEDILNEMIEISGNIDLEFLNELINDFISNFDKIKFSEFPHINIELILLKYISQTQKSSNKSSWQNILNEIAKEKPTIYGVLSKAKVINFNENEVKIEIEKGIIDKRRIEDILKRYVKNVEVIEKEKKISFKHEVLNHPIVNDVLTLFRGEIVKITEYKKSNTYPDGNPSS